MFRPRNSSAGAVLFHLLASATMLLVPPADGAPSFNRSVTVLVKMSSGATGWYTTPGSPVVHPIDMDGKVHLSVSTTARGAWTFCAHKPGCLAAYRYLNSSELLAHQSFAVALRPLPSGTKGLAQLLQIRSAYSTPPAFASSDQIEGQFVVSAPDGSGAAVSRRYRVPNLTNDGSEVISEIWWCPARPGKPVCLTGPLRVPYVCDLAFSPDGQWLACTFPEAQRGVHPTAIEQALYNPEGALWVYHLPTGERRLLSHLEAGCDLPCWSPDGASIAYVSPDSDTSSGYPSMSAGAGDPGAQGALRLLHWGGGDEILARGVNDSAPAFSPDGRLLAFYGSKGLQLIDLPSRHDEVVAAFLPADGDGPSMIWSPDGEWIATLAHPMGSAMEERASFARGQTPEFVYAIHRSGEPVRRISRGSLQFAWLQDGSLLVNGLVGAQRSGSVSDPRPRGPLSRNGVVPPMGVVISMDDWPVGPALLPRYQTVGPMPTTADDGVIDSLPQGLREH